MIHLTKERVLGAIGNGAAIDTIDRAGATRIVSRDPSGPEAGAIVNEALANLKRANSVWTPAQVVSQLTAKTQLVAGRGAVISRADLLSVALDTRTPFYIRATLRGVTEGANVRKMEFTTADFQQAIKR